MSHWKMAQSAPGGEEINPELMVTRDFPYPYSTPASLAIKAFALQLPDREGDFIETIERAHLVECLNIADLGVLAELGEKLGADGAMLRDMAADPAIERAVVDDHSAAVERGIYSTPTLEFSGGPTVVGAQPLEHLAAAYRQAAGEFPGAGPGFSNNN